MQKLAMILVVLAASPSFANDSERFSADCTISASEQTSAASALTRLPRTLKLTVDFSPTAAKDDVENVDARLMTPEGFSLPGFNVVPSLKYYGNDAEPSEITITFGNPVLVNFLVLDLDADFYGSMLRSLGAKDVPALDDAMDSTYTRFTITREPSPIREIIRGNPVSPSMIRDLTFPATERDGLSYRLNVDRCRVKRFDADGKAHRL
jgi:hypothetical protein